jgi:hypothetical protein
MCLKHSLLVAIFLLCEHSAAQSAKPAKCELYRQAPEAPHVIQLSTPGGGKLTYIGVAHTRDINSLSIAEIQRQWSRSRPSTAFSEGGVWPLADSRESAISKNGEGGLLRFLAEHGSVPLQSLEPPAAEETAKLLHSFTAEPLKLFYVLRQVEEYRRGHTEEAPDSVVQSILSEIGRMRGLPDKPSTIAELEQSVVANLPELKDWRSVSESYFEPFGSAHWTNAVACQSSQFRDEYMVSLLTRAVNRGEHAFAVVGVGHLAIQESLLKANLHSIQRN